MNEPEDLASSVSDKIEQLMGELEDLKKENQILKQINTTALMPNDKIEDSENQSVLPRMGTRSREEKISSYDEEIKRIVKETEIEQSNSEFYDSQERHYRGELAKLEQANFPNPKAEVLKQHFLEELDRISDDRFTNLGTGAEQTLKRKLRAVRIDNIASQLASLRSNAADSKGTGISPNTIPDLDSAENGILSDKQWRRDDSPSLSSSSVSHSSYYRPWLVDHPASVVSLPHSQFSSNSSLPRLNCIKGRGSEVFQEQFKKMQNNLLPSSATVPIPAKFRVNHKRSSSVSKTDDGGSPCVLRPQKPVPLCPTRSKSFTAQDRVANTGDIIGERLSGSIEKRSSVNSEYTRQASFLSGISDSTNGRASESPYSPVHIGHELSEINQERTEFVQSLLSKFEDDDHESFACTLQSVTRSPRHAKALFKKGMVEKSLRLLHGIDENWRFVYNSDIRERMGEALYNIARCIYRGEKLALQIYANVRMVRDQCERMLSNLAGEKKPQHNDLLSIREKISTIPFIQLSTYSHKPEAISYMTQLGVLYAFGEYLVIDSRLVDRLREEGRTFEEMVEPRRLIYIKRLICATLRNLTFRDPKNKVSICLLSEVMVSIVSQLDSENEDLLNSTASLLRNLAWKSEDVTKVSLTKCNATVGLVRALTQRNIKDDSILINVTNGLVNLTNHSPENKIVFCAAPGAIQYMIRFLSYKSTDGNNMVIANITGIFCNVSQHIASMPDHMQIVCKLNALGKLVTLLSSDDDFVLTHVCGILVNLFTSSESIASLWQLGVPKLLDRLRTNRNRLVAERSVKLLKYLLKLKDEDSLGVESVGDPVHLEANEQSPSEGEAIDPNFAPVRKLDTYRVRVKDFETQTAENEINREDELRSNEKIRKKSKQNKIPSFIKKLSFRKDDSDQTPELYRNNNQQSPSHFKVDTSPNRPETNTELPLGSQSSVKTLTQEYTTPHNSPQIRHYQPEHYPQTHHELIPMVRTDEIYPQYPYATSCTYPHHILDMPPPGPMYPPRPMLHPPHIGYMTPHYMDIHSKYHGAYSAHNSPYKPSHTHASPPPPLRPNHFNQTLNLQYTQPQRMSSNLQLNQISRHDAAIMKARLDKHSKSRSYTDSQGDLVTDL